MVEGEIARIGIARQRPPFWRRLATIAHASVLEREMVAVSEPTSDFIEWAMESRGQVFYMRSFVDLRTEPRWLPDFVSPPQLKSEFIGRIAAAAQVNLAKVQTAELKALVSGSGDSSLQSQVRFPFAFLPGPLDGGIDSIAAMPRDIEATLRQALSADELTPASFATLVNSALIFQMSPEFAQLAAEGLRRVKYQLRHVGTEQGAFSLLNGLATVAAVTRSGELAEELRVLVRFIKQRPGIHISSEDTMRIAMVAAAGYRDHDKWCGFVGKSLTELAFEDMSRDQAVVLGQQVQTLCQLDPMLWGTCGRADAACSAFAALTAASAI